MNDVFSQDLAAAALSVRGNLTITFNDRRFVLTLDRLQQLKNEMDERGEVANFQKCLFAAFYDQGMKPDEINAFLDDADRKKKDVKIGFEAPNAK